MNLKLIRCLLLLIISVLFYFYFTSNLEVISLLKEVSYVSIAILALLTIFLIISNGLILKSLLNIFKRDIYLKECIRISVFTAIGNYLSSFGGGTIGKAIYLKRRHDFTYTVFLASMSATYLLDLFIYGLLGIVIVLFIGGFAEYWGVFLLIIFSILCVIPIALAVFSARPAGRREGKFFEAFRDVLDGWNVIKRDSQLICKLCILLLVNHMVGAAELYVGFNAFSIKITIWDAFLIALISGLSMLVKLTPANMGIQEAVIATSSHILGIGFGEGLISAGLIRAVSMIVIFVLGVSSWVILGDVKKNTL